ncbi:ABC-2 type transport system permease protein [Nonomuraea solani]|uniref:Transport permease protein n=1 Tax=Nonomuraea solani TaxID=1144553 RepID=A0A1H6DCW0_9ACTN|nr:ABC transporter permease [Nonomuraea solani]SEG83118.1 ABC-2 type transport system permease protein [Nonomuraea solani]
MNPVLHAARLGLSRGWIEFKQQLTSVSDLAFTVISTAAFILVLYLQRDATVPGTNVSLAAATLPGVLALMIAVGSLLGAIGALSVEREDGTLLRAKALPQGMVGYLVGRVVSLSVSTVASIFLIAVAGVVLVPAVREIPPGGWLVVALVTVLGILFSLPLGAIIGALSPNPQSGTGIAMLTIGAVTSISGIFYPISALAGWMQGLAQAFPVYWLGLAMRSGMLPDAAAAAELGGSWRTTLTFTVLVAWTVVALLLAPPVLRRMARRESGSAMEQRRVRAMQRIT